MTSCGSTRFCIFLLNDFAVQLLPRFQGENLVKNEQLCVQVEESAGAKKCSLNQLIVDPKTYCRTVELLLP